MIHSGFFNARNHDRQYYASDISRLFNSLIIDGVFQNVGNQFIARAGSGMHVIIPSGMGYFNSSWIFNDNDYIQNIADAPYIANYKRIDGIFLKMYPATDADTRINSIYYMKGTETGGTPARPVPTSTDGEVYKPICYISVNNGVTTITQSMITNMVGTSSTPFVSGILKTINAQTLLTQWNAEFHEWMTENEIQMDAWESAQQTDFEEWFDGLRIILDGDVAGHLQNEIDEIIDGIVITADEI